MTQDIKFKTERGSMLIHLDGMFPCTKEKFRKLLKYMKEDVESFDENIEIMKNWLLSEAHYCDEKMKKSASSYFKFHQEWSDCKAHIDSGKWSNGVVMSAAELKEEKAKMKHYKEQFTEFEIEARGCKRKCEQYTGFLVIIEMDGGANG